MNDETVLLALAYGKHESLVLALTMKLMSLAMILVMKAKSLALTLDSESCLVNIPGADPWKTVV